MDDSIELSLRVEQGDVGSIRRGGHHGGAGTGCCGSRPRGAGYRCRPPEVSSFRNCKPACGCDLDSAPLPDVRAMARRLEKDAASADPPSLAGRLRCGTAEVTGAS